MTHNGVLHILGTFGARCCSNSDSVVTTCHIFAQMEDLKLFCRRFVRRKSENGKKSKSIIGNDTYWCSTHSRNLWCHLLLESGFVCDKLHTFHGNRGSEACFAANLLQKIKKSERNAKPSLEMTWNDILYILETFGGIFHLNSHTF